MQVLVTGSEGSLMQWTIKHLLENGHDVVGADNHARYDDYDHVTIVENTEYDFEKVDLTDTEATFELFEKYDFDGVINAAAMIWGVKGFHEYPATILSNDLMIDRNTLEAAVEYDVERVAYISSSIVYEQDEPPHREGDERTAGIPSTDYGLSKLVGERFSEAFLEQYDIDYTIWRPFNVITPFEEAEDEAGMSHVFADFIRKLLEDKQNPLEVFGTGEQVRCFTYIDEVAEAIATQSFADVTRNEDYNLANPEPVTMKELARRIYAKGNERGIISDDRPLEFTHTEIYEDDVDRREPLVEKAAEHFGWEPQIKLDDSLDICLDEMFGGDE